MIIKGLIFDFDGLILDTEIPVYLSWQEIYQAHGVQLPLQDYARCIGSSKERFDPLVHLSQQLSTPIDPDRLAKFQQERELQLLADQVILPGVEQLLKTAKTKGLPCAIASSSDRKWVKWNLERMGLLQYFPVILTADEVKKVKPHPDLFLAALQDMHITPDQAIGFEDSPNGIAAAKAAGIRIIAIPNQLTRQLDLSQADRVYNSMADINFDELLEHPDRIFEQRL
jgi:HAD superfamily hydrolase (TIGR01509 family)